MFGLFSTVKNIKIAAEFLQQVLASSHKNY
jgi:hypothetical protein